MNAVRESRFSPGDWVVYQKTKFSRHPGPRARSIQPTAHGDGYVYVVDKFWVVEDVESDGSVQLRTRTGKRHQLPSDDVSLRPANLWERLWYRDKFEPQAEAIAAE